ncbi:hypothetical protein A5651_21585 [Mycobacterium sp. 1274761.0]|nr:hypothetical protein A5651_21585 [Mycobacterium sp. 1274761.0]
MASAVTAEVKSIAIERFGVVMRSLLPVVADLTPSNIAHDDCDVVTANHQMHCPPAGVLDYR